MADMSEGYIDIMNILKSMICFTCRRPWKIEEFGINTNIIKNLIYIKYIRYV